MEKRTTVSVEKKTLVKLKTLKITKRESYDEIINRLITKHNGEGKTNVEGER